MMRREQFRRHEMFIAIAKPIHASSGGAKYVNVVFCPSITTSRSYGVDCQRVALSINMALLTERKSRFSHAVCNCDPADLRFARTPDTSSCLLVSRLHGRPTPIRIEAIHGLKNFERLRPEVFFIDDAVLTHHE